MSHSLPHSPDDYPIMSPDGRRIGIPWGYDPTAENFPTPEEPEAFQAFYQREGFVVVRSLIAPALCARLRAAYAAEVKPSRDFFTRHDDGRPARHTFTAAGFMKYPIVNVQDLPARRYPRFRTAALDVITAPAIRRVAEILLGEPGKLVHTLFSEGNQQTWAHRDGTYLDSERHGTMVGFWIALEDIHPGAGRFYLYPRSHRLVLCPTGDEAKPNHPAHKAYMLRVLRAQRLEPIAPALRPGDAVIWGSEVIHGSLETREPSRSRLALTGHYIAASDRPVWLRGTPVDPPEQCYQGVRVCLHCDRNGWRNGLLYDLEARCPDVIRTLRRLAGRL